MMSASPDTRSVVAVFDLDGTITRSDTYVRFLLAYLTHKPLRIFRSCWLPFAVSLYYLGARDNTWLKVVFLRTILGGATRSEVDSVVQKFVPEILRKEVRPKALEAIETHRHRGHRLVMATASLDIYSLGIARELSFDAVVSTRVDWRDGRLSGALDGGNCYGENKRAAVELLLGDREALRLVSYSDNESDLPLLAWSDTAVVVNPPRSFQARAAERGFEVARW